MSNVQTQVSKQIAFLFDEDGPCRKEALGGKGAGLVELVQMGVPVPAGFTVVTAVARAYAQHGVVPRRLEFHLRQKLRKLEQATGKRFGDLSNPLLVSVRSGAAVSMPGMMDTVLNLGMNLEVAAAMAARSDARFAWDTYQRFLSMFGDVVLGIERNLFEAERDELARSLGVKAEEMPSEALQELCLTYRRLIAECTGKSVPDQAWDQLNLAVEAVLRSWNNPRAVEFRRIHGIDNGLGTAVNIQAMVFGNRDQRSCSGVAFSRNVTSGDVGVWGEFLVQSQGEDVVAGIRTPSTLAVMKAWNEDLYNELAAVLAKLDKKRNRPVEVEFTVESGKFFLLQVRNAKLTAVAAATTAVHFVWDKRLDKGEAMQMVTPEQVRALREQGFDQAALQQATVLGRGLAASLGAAVGKVVNTSAEAVAAAARGEKVVLVRPDTSPDDLPGMQAAAAIVTMTGGATSHAAVVARGLGKVAVVGVKLAEGASLRSGETISVDGVGGLVVAGAVPSAQAVNKKEVNIFLKWVAQDEAKRWPAPRLNFAYYEQSELVPVLISDFYLTDAMVAAARGTALEAEAQSLRLTVHTQVAERLAMYLVVAFGGEIRHMREAKGDLAATQQELTGRFKVEMTGSHEHRGAAQVRTVKALGQESLAGQIRFAELCSIMFHRGQWGSSYGGRKWGAIADAAYGFLTGKLSHSLFADHAFDLQHNGGSVFGKHGMIAAGYRRAQELLELKKHATGLRELYQVLVRGNDLPLRSELVTQSLLEAAGVDSALEARRAVGRVSESVRLLYERVVKLLPEGAAPAPAKPAISPRLQDKAKSAAFDKYMIDGITKEKDGKIKLSKSPLITHGWKDLSGENNASVADKVFVCDQSGSIPPKSPTKLVNEQKEKLPLLMIDPQESFLDALAAGGTTKSPSNNGLIWEMDASWADKVLAESLSMHVPPVNNSQNPMLHEVAHAVGYFKT